MVLFIFSFTLMVFAFCKSDYEQVSTFQKGIYRWFVTGFPVIFITPSNPLTHIVIIFIMLCLLADMIINYNFTFGLVAFLVGHVFFHLAITVVYGFNLWIIVLAIIIAIITFIPFRNIKDENMKMPMFVYLIGISLAVMSAFSVSLLLGIGYAVFMLSDFILAQDKFIKPIKNVFVWNSVVYYLGIALITLAVI